MTGGPELARCHICGEEHPIATMVTGHRQPEELDGPPPEDRAPPEPSDWWLRDGEAMSARHPRSFFIPPAARRRALRRGDLVRLEFVYGPHADRDGEGHAERMWVEVLEQGDDARAVGRLSNRPRRLAALAIGDLVAFSPEHVLTIDYDDAELGYPQDQSPIVDAAIIADDRAPDVVVRAPGPREDGAEEWWMLVRENPSSPATESVNSLTDRFPGLAEPLAAGAGVWLLQDGERDSARWRRVAGDELAASEDLQGLLAWLAQTAETMRRG